MKIFLDIETIPGQRPGIKEQIAMDVAPPGSMKRAETIELWEREQKPSLIEERWRRTSFEGDRGEVICIGWAVNDRPVQSITRELHENEGAMLATWFGEIQQTLHDPPAALGFSHDHFQVLFEFGFVFRPLEEKAAVA